MKKPFIHSAISLACFLSSAQAAVIYSHSFSDTDTGALHGKSLDFSSGTHGATTGASWVANDFFQANGSHSRTSAETYHHSAYVSFNPINGYLYTISLTINATRMDGVNRWIALSLGSGTPTVESSFASGAGTDSASIARRSDGMVLRRFGPNGEGIVDLAGSLSGEVSILLDTTDAAQWTYRWVADGVTSDSYDFGATGAVDFIRISSDGGSFTSERIISDFSVTAVPEPSTMVLSLSMLALFSRRQRKN